MAGGGSWSQEDYGAENRVSRESVKIDQKSAPVPGAGSGPGNFRESVFSLLWRLLSLK